MIRKCPKCGREYTNEPALSREDNMTEICSVCGTMEALATMGIEDTPDVREQIEKVEESYEQGET